MRATVDCAGVRRWQINPRARLHWRSWDDDYVLFNEASGQTHYLNELGAGALDEVAAATLDAAELGRRLARRYELSLDEDLERYVTGMVADLDELGLISPCPR